MIRALVSILLIALTPIIGLGQIEMSSDPDSFLAIWRNPSNPDTTRILALNDFIWRSQLFKDAESRSRWIDSLYAFTDLLGNQRGLSAAHNLRGMAYYIEGDYANALTYFQKSLVIREELELPVAAAGTLNNIGLLYWEIEDYSNALRYFEKVYDLFETSGDSSLYPMGLGNKSVIYLRQGEMEKALNGLTNVLDYLQRTGDKASAAVTYNHLGEVYVAKGNYEKGLEYTLECISELKKFGITSELPLAQINAGNIYLRTGRHDKAIEYCREGLIGARTISANVTQKKACDCLYAAYKGVGMRDSAFNYLERKSALEDSIEVEEATKSLQRMEFRKMALADSISREKEKFQMQMEYELDVQKKKRSRNIAFGLGLMGLLIAGGLFSRIRYIRRSRAEIAREKERSDELLLNILPAEVAEELKRTGRSHARDYDMVTILFTDFVSFTKTSESLTAAELVEEVNTCFEAFDRILEKYGIEKIKTIGDAYMAAGGLPIPSDDSVKNTILAALEMQDFIIKRKDERQAENQMAFEMRVGIHSGPVVAGIVGIKKFQYDIWGDAVNTASRMENASEPGRVNISRDTYELIKDDAQFEFERRGKVTVKGKGEMEMYYVRKRGI